MMLPRGYISSLFVEFPQASKDFDIWQHNKP